MMHYLELLTLQYLSADKIKWLNNQREIEVYKEALRDARIIFASSVEGSGGRE